MGGEGMDPMEGQTRTESLKGIFEGTSECLKGRSRGGLREASCDAGVGSGRAQP